jgi:hypothetical protein
MAHNAARPWNRKMTGSDYPDDYARFMGNVVGLTFLGLYWLLFRGGSTYRSYRSVREAYAEDPSLRGKWLFAWGWPIVGAFGLLVSVALSQALILLWGYYN